MSHEARVYIGPDPSSPMESETDESVTVDEPDDVVVDTDE